MNTQQQEGAVMALEEVRKRVQALKAAADPGAEAERGAGPRRHLREFGKRQGYRKVLKVLDDVQQYGLRDPGVITLGDRVEILKTSRWGAQGPYVGIIGTVAKIRADRCYVKFSNGFKESFPFDQLKVLSHAVHVGDRVRCNDSAWDFDTPLAGMTGTVVPYKSGKAEGSPWLIKLDARQSYWNGAAERFEDVCSDTVSLYPEEFDVLVEGDSGYSFG